MQEYKKLIGPISIISIAYLSSRILGFLREVLLAKWTGVSSASDTLDLAFIIPDFLFYLSAGGYLAITLIPLMSSKSQAELNEYFLSLLYGLSIIFVMFSVVIYSFRNKFAKFLGIESIEFFHLDLDRCKYWLGDSDNLLLVALDRHRRHNRCSVVC